MFRETPFLGAGGPCVNTGGCVDKKEARQGCLEEGSGAFPRFQRVIPADTMV